MATIRYQSLTQVEHVKARTELYLGSTCQETSQQWVFDEVAGRMVLRDTAFVPALLKLFDEVLVNALDHVVRLEGVDGAQQTRHIRVSIDRTSGRVEIVNDGDTIPVVKHEQHTDMWTPELVFGSLLSGSNFDDSGQRVTGGTHGIGAKAVAILSTLFEVECLDARRGLLYTQRWTENMAVAHAARVIPTTRKRSHTRVAYVADFARFGEVGMSDALHSLMVRRTRDACALTSRAVTVHLDGASLDVRCLERYCDLWLGAPEARARVYEAPCAGWEVVVAATDGHDGHTHGGGPPLAFQHMSWVNGVHTPLGGRHVDHIAQQLSKRLPELLERKHKVAVRPADVRAHLMLFVRATVPNPAFDSQSKACLTTPPSKWGAYRPDLSEQFFVKLLAKTPLAERLLEAARMAADRNMRRTDGAKRSSVRVRGADDANFSGTPRSQECTLILTEGLSAKTTAVAGISALPHGRDLYGIYPLRGKPLNARHDTAKLATNEELIGLKKLLGLETGREYADTAPLRYGRVLLLADQDLDGSHIRALLANLFACLWPSLLRVPGFLGTLLTPIVRVRAGHSPEPLRFYSMQRFETWRAEQPAARLARCQVTYLKGLGSSSPEEAKDYFRRPQQVTYVFDDDAPLDLAFNKGRADDRKQWLARYDRTAVLDPAASRQVTMGDLVHKELVHFSAYDVQRSIPCFADGLKISQRKILWTAFRRGLRTPIRVATLSSAVVEAAAYHHGEASLHAAITAMAQDFVGSCNNINLLTPVGALGSRVAGGDDAAAPRYTHTHLSPLSTALFPAEDTPLLSKARDDDNRDVEPLCYVPLLPMVLVNGAAGIGTGFSTNVPCFNPRDVLANVRRLLAHDQGRDGTGGSGSTDLPDLPDLPELVPWYRGFRGSIRKVNGKWMSVGVFARVSAVKVRITELPVGTWSAEYKDFLEEGLDPECGVSRVETYYTDVDVDFVVTFKSRQALDALLADVDAATGFSQLQLRLRLVASKGLSVSNMYLLSETQQVCKFADPNDILRAHFSLRLGLMERRRERVIAALQSEVRLEEAKRAFIRAHLEGTDLAIHTRSTPELTRWLADRDYAVDEDGGYGYLTRLPLGALTADRVQQLERLVAGKRERLEQLLRSTPREMWVAELDALEPLLDTGAVQSVEV
jgi:DNA topoisomerase-2